jgi:hypothetical protein
MSSSRNEDQSRENMFDQSRCTFTKHIHHPLPHIGACEGSFPALTNEGDSVLVASEVDGRGVSPKTPSASRARLH